MGAPVVHFEVVGKEPDKLRGYYADLFGWEIDHVNAFGYGLVSGAGIGGGIGGCPDASYAGHVTFYVGVPDVEEAVRQAEVLGGTRLFGPAKVAKGVELGQFADPEGHVVGLMRTAP